MALVLPRVARIAAFAAAVFSIVPLLSHAASRQPINIGITVAQTGPFASLGIPQANTVALLPRKVDGREIHYTVLDSRSSPSAAAQTMRQLISDHHADVVIAASATPAALALVPIAGETRTPYITVASSGAIVSPVTGARRWVFKTTPDNSLFATAIANAMQKQHVKTLAFISETGSYGEDWKQRMAEYSKPRGIKIVDHEVYQPTDTSALGQVLKLIAAHPDAILIAAAGTPAVLPEKELRAHGYKGRIYQAAGAANDAVMRLGGSACNGTLLPASPLQVASQLPDSNPSKKAALEYIHRYDAKYGAGTADQFGASIWDASHLIMRALPVALKTGAQPGTEAFRAALRDAMEHVTDLHGARGDYNFSPTDHAGLGVNSVVTVEMRDGKWIYQPSL